MSSAASVASDRDGGDVSDAVPLLQALVTPTVQVAGIRMSKETEQRLLTSGALCVLFIALLAMSSLGAALDLVTEVGPFLKAFWRALATAGVLVPAAAVLLLYRHYRDSRVPAWKRRPREADLIPLHAAIRNGITCGLANAWWLGWFILSLEKTSIGHAYLFSNCHSVLIVAGRLVFGMPVNPLEVVGAAVAVAGGVVVSMDHTDSTAHGQGPTTYGDLLACVSCLGGLVFVLMAKTGQQKLGVVPFTAIMQSTASVAFFVTSCLADPVAPSVMHPMDYNTGVLGFLHANSNRLPVIAYIVVVPGLMGMVGYVASMKVLAPLVVSVVMLMEPVASAAIGVALRVSPLPGTFTYVGTAAVLTGLGLVTWGSVRRPNMTVKELCIEIRAHVSRLTGRAQPHDEHRLPPAVARSRALARLASTERRPGLGSPPRRGRLRTPTLTARAGAGGDISTVFVGGAGDVNASSPKGFVGSLTDTSLGPPQRLGTDVVSAS